jgi:hypothetical protein
MNLLCLFLGIVSVVALPGATVSAQAVPNLAGRWTSINALKPAPASEPAIADMAMWSDGPLTVTQDAERTTFANGRMNVVCVQQPLGSLPLSRGVSATTRFRVEAAVKASDAAVAVRKYQGSAIWLGALRNPTTATLVISVPTGAQTTMRLSVYLDRGQLVLERALERDGGDLAGSRVSVRYTREVNRERPE